MFSLFAEGIAMIYVGEFNRRERKSNMGKMKEKAIMEEEHRQLQQEAEEDEVTPLTEEEAQAANQEAYYWHLLHEFIAINKYFGQTKVMSDLKMIRESIEAKEKENKPRIQLI